MLIADGQAQQPVAPAMHRRIPHPDPQSQATFGYTGAFGDIDDPLFGSGQDLVLTSIQYSITFQAQFIERLGAGFAFAGVDLDVQTSLNPLLPAQPYQPQTQLGQLDVAIGDLRGTGAAPQANLVCFGATLNAGDVPGCPPASPRLLGSVEIYDLTQTLVGQPLSLQPPLDGGQCHTQQMGFGMGLAIGHVDNPVGGSQDLVVGAPTADAFLGRVYVFFGHAGFLGDPQADWVGFKSPAPPSEGTQHFGFDVQVVDLNDDGYGELIVGAPSKGSPLSQGRTYVYDGLRVAALSRGIVHDGGSFAPDQTLVPPASIQESANIGFGWQVFDIGDMAGPQWGEPEGRPDIAVHSEGGVWVPPVGPYQPVPAAGALIVYRAWDPDEVSQGLPAGQPFVKVPGILMQSPLVWESFEQGPGAFEERLMHMPETSARFGRAVARVRLATPTGEPVVGLLVGEPDANVHNPSDPAYPDDAVVIDAGRAFFFKAPLDVGTNATQNALGSFVLLEPHDDLDETDPGSLSATPLDQGNLSPQPAARFGAWMGSGVYTTASPFGQFFVSSRQRNLDVLPHPAAGIGAGQVYTFFNP
jgi:hypothetical protein